MCVCVCVCSDACGLALGGRRVQGGRGDPALDCRLLCVGEEGNGGSVGNEPLIPSPTCWALIRALDPDPRSGDLVSSVVLNWRRAVIFFCNASASYCTDLA